MLKISQSALEAIYHHSEETFPEECCGGLSSAEPNGAVLKSHRCTNIQNKLHQKNPTEHPRTAKDGYYIDELELMELQKEIDEKKRHLLGIYHSHPDEESYFSAEDKQKAMWDDQPMWPDAHYLIASVKAGKVAYAKSFTWDQEKKDFVEEAIETIPD